MSRQSQRNWGKDLLEEHPLARQPVKVGSNRARVTVGADMVGAKCIDGDQEEIPGRIRLSLRLNGLDNE